MIRLILVRHGNTFEEHETAVQVGARTDLSLTAKGRLQAEGVADYLLARGIAPKAIYAGSLKRQAESAQILSERLHVTVTHQAALTEIDYGPWEALPAEEIAKGWPKEYAAWTEEFVWPKGLFGSSLEEHKAQIENWLNFLRSTFASGDIVVGFTSNGLLRFFKNEKVKTGHFCELALLPQGFEVRSWNVNPTR